MGLRSLSETFQLVRGGRFIQLKFGSWWFWWLLVVVFMLAGDELPLLYDVVVRIESSIRNVGRPFDRHGSLGRLRGRRLPELLSFFKTGFMIFFMMLLLVKFVLLQVKLLLFFKEVSR